MFRLARPLVVTMGNSWSMRMLMDHSRMVLKGWEGKVSVVLDSGESLPEVKFTSRSGHLYNRERHFPCVGHCVGLCLPW